MFYFLPVFYFISATFMNLDIKEWVIENDLLVNCLKVSISYCGIYYHLTKFAQLTLQGGPNFVKSARELVSCVCNFQEGL